MGSFILIEIGKEVNRLHTLQLMAAPELSILANQIGFSFCQFDSPNAPGW